VWPTTIQTAHPACVATSMKSLTWWATNRCSRHRVPISQLFSTS
jgi:hypothetical protein